MTLGRIPDDEVMVIAVGNEDGQQLCRFGVARVFTDNVVITRLFGPALARVKDHLLAVVDLAANGTGQDVGENEFLTSRASSLRIGVFY